MKLPRSFLRGTGASTWKPKPENSSRRRLPQLKRPRLGGASGESAGRGAAKEENLFKPSPFQSKNSCLRWNWESFLRLKKLAGKRLQKASCFPCRTWIQG